MVPDPTDTPALAPRGGEFATTRWSVVMRASASNSAEALRALDQLCRTYWDPLYAFARRSGHQPEDARDLVQGFIASLLERRDFERAAPENGKLRCFLLASLRHYLLNEWKRSTRLKRGGGAAHLPLDLDAAEQALASHTEAGLAPDALYDRRWALRLLESVLDRLRTGEGSKSKHGLTEDLMPSLIGDHGAGTYAQIGLRHGMSEGAVKMAAQRLRGRFRALLREEVQQTVSDTAQADVELRHLIEILRNS